jgi:uncharacterized membrane protein AbrB (regulator of aidB expression)
MKKVFEIARPSTNSNGNGEEKAANSKRRVGDPVLLLTAHALKCFVEGTISRHMTFPGANLLLRLIIEAITRARQMMDEGETELDVHHLEKILPQLMLDFA